MIRVTWYEKETFFEIEQWFKAKEYFLDKFKAIRSGDKRQSSLSIDYITGTEDEPCESELFNIDVYMEERSEIVDHETCKMEERIEKQEQKLLVSFFKEAEEMIKPEYNKRAKIDTQSEDEKEPQTS